jgi:hypothetical protein
MSNLNFICLTFSFCKRLFETSCSEDFLIGWGKTVFYTQKLPVKEIFQSAGLQFIIPPLGK